MSPPVLPGLGAPIAFRWKAVRRDGNVYVREFVSGRGGFVEYGPMTHDCTAEQFVAGRKKELQEGVTKAARNLAMNKAGLQ